MFSASSLSPASGGPGHRLDGSLSPARPRIRIRIAFWALSLGMLVSAVVKAEPALTIAVASNFRSTMQALADQYTADSGRPIRISSASTGKLFAQISNGAPFDLLFAADAERPQRLEETGLGQAGTRFTYAVGTLVLWSRDTVLGDTDCRTMLASPRLRSVAIANPEIAPYGAAARQTLRNLDLWRELEPRLVIGENIAQVLQFVSSGNASLGFIAYSQSLDPRLPDTTCAWTVPSNLHEPIEQQAIVLRHAADRSDARDFMAFVRSETGRSIVARSGFAVPPVNR